MPTEVLTELEVRAAENSTTLNDFFKRRKEFSMCTSSSRRYQECEW